ncbi:MAG: LegC family aminotransferase [Campylobacterales bacterium]
MFKETIDFIRQLYGQPEGFIALHEPRFVGNEKAYVADAIDSTFVSSVGKYVDRFEQMVADYTGAKYAIATVNGTAALHVALRLAGVKAGDEVITQPLTFVATCNAIAYAGATPHFTDVDLDTLGLSPQKLHERLEQIGQKTPEGCINKTTGKRIAACVPMHAFGHPARIDEIAALCAEWGIALVEDAAESLGSFYKERHTGTFGLLGTLSFNGNKTITTGGGGMILTDDEALAKAAKHLTTTAKVPHPYEYMHDTVGYNYRLPNLNAALGCAQMEQLDRLLQSKRELASEYGQFFQEGFARFVKEPENSRSNYWLNAIILPDAGTQRSFLEETNQAGAMTRPIWRLMNRLEMYRHSPAGNLDNAIWLEERVVNIPSSARL